MTAEGMPTIKIGAQVIGTTTPTGVIPRGVVALARLVIPWGREDIFAPVEGHAVTLELIDFDGTSSLVTARTVIGQPVLITRVVDGVTETIVNGQVVSEDAERVRVQVPSSPEPSDAIRIRLTIRDHIGQLARICPIGTSPKHQPMGEGGWRPNWLDLRAKEMEWRAGGRIKIVDLPKTVWKQPAAGEDEQFHAAYAQHRPYRNDELPDILTVLCQLYAASTGLGWPDIRPNGEVRQGQPLTFSGIELKQFLGPYNVISYDSVLPARQVIVPSQAAHVTSTQASRPTELRTEVYADSFTLDANGEWKSVLERDQGPMSAVIGTRADGESNPVTLDLAPNVGWWSGAAASAPGFINNVLPAINAVQLCLDEAAARAAKIINFHALPPLTVRRAAPDGTTTSWDLLSPWTHDKPVFLKGSKFHDIDAAPRAVQIIGGELTWDRRGWSHKLSTSPVIDTAPRNLLLDQVLPPTAGALLSSLNQSLHISDLAAVTRSYVT